MVLSSAWRIASNALASKLRESLPDSGRLFSSVHILRMTLHPESLAAEEFASI